MTALFGSVLRVGNGLLLEGPSPLVRVRDSYLSFERRRLVVRKDLTRALERVGGQAYIVACCNEPIALREDPASTEHVRLVSGQQLTLDGRLSLVTRIDSNTEAWVTLPAYPAEPVQSFWLVPRDGVPRRVVLPEFPEPIIHAIAGDASCLYAAIANAGEAHLVEWRGPEAPSGLRRVDDLIWPLALGASEGRLLVVGLRDGFAAIARAADSGWRVKSSEVEVDDLVSCTLDGKGRVWLVAVAPSPDARTILLVESESRLVPMELEHRGEAFWPRELAYDSRAGVILFARGAEYPNWLLVEQSGWSFEAGFDATAFP